MRIWPRGRPSSSSSPWLLRRRRPRRLARPEPDCRRRRGPVAGQSRREPIARPTNIHITLAVWAWWATPLVRRAMIHAAPAQETTSDPLQAARGLPGASSCRPPTARRPPRHQCRRLRRAPLKSYTMSSATLLVTPGIALGKALCILRRMRKASVHAEAPMKVAGGCGAVMRLLLTWLGVEAHHGPPNSRRHLRQRKPWSARSSSLTFPPWRKSLMNGGPPSGASSASPTTTS